MNLRWLSPASCMQPGLIWTTSHPWVAGYKQGLWRALQHAPAQLQICRKDPAFQPSCPAMNRAMSVAHGGAIWVMSSRACQQAAGIAAGIVLQHTARTCSSWDQIADVPSRHHQDVQGLCVNEFMGLDFEGDDGGKLRQGQVANGEQVLAAPVLAKAMHRPSGLHYDGCRSASHLPHPVQGCVRQAQYVT